jgi:hypothetical protein
LDGVVLTNQSGAPRRESAGKVTSRKRRLSQKGTFGRYHSARPGTPPRIELYGGNIAAEISPHALVPMGRTGCLAMVVFHEIGHHVYETVRPEFRRKEYVVDDWGRTLLRNYLLML